MRFDSLGGRVTAHVLFGFVAAALVTGQARAEEPETAAGAEQSAGVIALALHGDELPREALISALRDELAREVVLDSAAEDRNIEGVVTIDYRRATAELAVTWDSGGRTIGRVITASSELSELVADSAMLAGNLARQQVDWIAPPPAAPTAPVAAPPPPSVAEAPRAPLRPEAPPPPPAPKRVYATASVFYPLATHGGQPEVTSYFDFNLFYGRVGAVEGGELGLVNVVTRSGRHPASVSGFQVGLLANVVKGDVAGLQVAAITNTVTGETRGLQISPVNLAADVQGVQIGLVNVARRVRGVSIGLVNVADDIDGVPLAPVSVTKTGGVHPVFWSGSSGLGNAGIKFATRKTYTLFYGSYHHAFEQEFVGAGLAIGGRIPLGSIFHADVDASGTWLIAPGLSEDAGSNSRYHEQLVQPRVRLLLGLRAAKHFGVFVGGAGVGQIRAERDWDRVSASIGSEILGGVEL